MHSLKANGKNIALVDSVTVKKRHDQSNLLKVVCLVLAYNFRKLFQEYHGGMAVVQ